MKARVIHYCWFGGKELPKSARKCISSWKKHFPDFEIKQWDETNVDFTASVYMEFCYEKGLWAFLSDYVRLMVVEREGGIYFDTDVEVVRRPGELIQECTAWFGIENPCYVNTGLGFAADAHHPAVKTMMAMYNRSREELEEEYNTHGALLGCPRLNTAALLEYGLKLDGLRQTVCQAEILPMEWLCPYNDLTGEMNKTPNTVSIHWYTKSACSPLAYWRSKCTRPLHRLLQYLGIRTYIFKSPGFIREK